MLRVVLLFFSQLFIRSGALSATPASQGKSPAAPTSCGRLCKGCQRGACDLPEEDLNSALLNVFLERQAFPPGDDVDGTYCI